MTKITELKAQRERFVKQLPPFKKILRSTISQYYLTCGYKRCICHKGEKHGPFIYLSAKEEGRLKMNFVPHSLVNEVKSQVKNYNKFWSILCKICQLNRKILWLEHSKKIKVQRGSK
ncbi:MAG: DUF6788 family protein [Candidatus Hydrogenedentota bacterium]